MIELVTKRAQVTCDGLAFQGDYNSEVSRDRRDLFGRELRGQKALRSIFRGKISDVVGGLKAQDARVVFMSGSPVCNSVHYYISANSGSIIWWYFRASAPADRFSKGGPACRARIAVA